MKLMITALALVAVTAPAIAMQATPATPAAPQAPVAPAARFSLDTPLEVIAADPAGLAVLETHLPGITAHPFYPQFKGMGLRQLQPLSQGLITTDMLTSIAAALAALV